MSKKRNRRETFTDATLLSAMTGIARFVQDKELKKFCVKRMGLAQRQHAQALLNYCLNEAFDQKRTQYSHHRNGRILISALPDIATQPDMTAHWEAQLTDISQKQASYQQFMFTLNQMLPDLVRFVDFTALRRLSQISKRFKYGTC